MAGIEITGMERLHGQIARITGGALQADLVDNLHQQGLSIRSDMAAAANINHIQQRAMDAVNVTPVSDGIEIVGGRGGGLAQVLFPGAEFGAMKSRKVSYATHSRSGRPYRVARRTTMQFTPLVYLGREGYFFFPTIRKWMPLLIEQSNKIVAEALGKAS